jgi:cyclopropane-fatty-acyl-phospholipid synthase
MKKAMLESVLQNIQYGTIKVRYWDGLESQYGNGEPTFKFIFNKEPSLSDLNDVSLVLGELYMDGILDYEGKFDNLLQIMEMNKALFSSKQSTMKKIFTTAVKSLASVADKMEQKRNIHTHYDLGNDFFSLWLDKSMCYSCAYFKTPQDSLYDAQIQKLDLILKKLRLEPGQKLLDIGCGWGSLIIRAAEKFGVKALGITLSEEQYASVTKRIRDAGMTNLVDVKLVNYLDLNPKEYQFDRIVSVGMFEHVGKDYLGKYMQKVNELLLPGGLSMLHTLINQQEVITNAWVKRYIFPGGYIPSLRETYHLLPDFDFRVIHDESLRMHYVKTLEYWYQNFTQQLDNVYQKFDERFVRMWSLYLQGSAAILRTGNLDLHQILFSKGPINDLPLTLADVYTKD